MQHLLTQVGAFVGKNVLAVAAGTVLLGTAAVGVFAAQEGVILQEETPTAEITETATETATEEATETPTEDATGTPTEEATGTPEPDPTETPEATPTEEGEDDGEDGDDDGIGGIPDSNPVFSPDDDGECEKHETRVKTTPSGRQVNVPCHVVPDDDEAGQRGRGHNKNNDAEDDGEEEGEE